MLIAGEWVLNQEDIAIPVVMVNVLAASGAFMEEPFLVDCGADRTVLSNYLLTKLGLPVDLPPTGIGLSGIGGASNYVVVKTCLEFRTQGPIPVRFSGEFSAFTDPAATEISLLGRDILNKFDLLLSHSRGEVILARENHCCRAVQSGDPDAA
jgi:hypothetical protein